MLVGQWSKLLTTLPSLVVGGSITEFSIFFPSPSIYQHPPKFTEILEISTRSRYQKLYFASYKFSSFFFGNKQAFKSYFTPNEKNPPFWLVFTLSKLIKDLILFALRETLCAHRNLNLKLKGEKIFFFFAVCVTISKIDLRA